MKKNLHLSVLKHSRKKLKTSLITEKKNNRIIGMPSLLLIIFTLLMSNNAMAQFNVPFSGNNTLTCGLNTILRDHNGTINYANNANGYTVLNNFGTGKISISGTFSLRVNDNLKIYNGAGTGGTLLYTYTNLIGGTITSFTSAPGQILTVQFSSNNSGTSAGFDMNVVYSGPTISISATPSATICSGNSATLTASGASTYTWISVNTNAAITVSPLSTSTYSVIGKSPAGCELNSITVTVNAVPTISVTSGAICEGQSYAIIASGANTYTYSGGSSIVSPTVNTNYTISGTSAEGCVSAIDAVSSVTVNAVPTISVTSGAICEGELYSILASGASTYTYSGGSSIVSPTVNTNYTISGTSAEGCVSAVDAVSSVTVNPLPTISVTSGAICEGELYSILANGASTYTYSSGSAIVSPTVNTNYTVSGTSAEGCVSAVDAVSSVTVNPLPTISVTSGAICEGELYSILASGASTYTYSSGSAVVSPIVNSSYTISGTSAEGCVSAIDAVSSVTVNTIPTISVTSGAICEGELYSILANGASTYTYSGGSSIVSPTVNTNYTISGTSAEGCVSAIDAVSSVTVNAVPTISVTSGAICEGQSYSIIASGASTYTYSGGSSIVSPTVNTNYTISGTSAEGCVSAIDAVSSVTVNAVPTISVTSGAICEGQSYAIIASGASTYTYSGGSAVVSPFINSSYTISGTSAEGCVSALGAVSSVTVNAVPTISVTSGAICDGQSYSIIASGASTYTYSSGSAVVSPIVNSSYTISGTSAEGCVSAIDAVSSVTVNAVPTISVTSGAICEGQSYSIIASGASTYTYSGGSSIVSPIVNSSYTISGTSAEGCVSAIDAVSSVTVNAMPTISVTGGAICEGQSYSIIASGASTYTYSSGSSIVSPTVNTNYTISGTSVEGCVSAIDAVSSVTVNAVPTISVTSGAICDGQSYSIIASGASTYTYSGGSSIVSPIVNSSYTISGTSAEGCASAIDAVSSVTVNAVPTISVTSGSICEGQSYSIIASGASTYTYSGGSAVVSPSINSSYTISGTSTEGCVSAIDAVSSVTVNTLPTISVTASNTLICVGEVATLTATTTAITYTWSTGSNSSSILVSPVVTTNYTVNATDLNGCSANTNVSITVNSCTGIIEALDSSISIYPNPNNGIVNITLTSALAQNSTLEIYDAIGKLVVKQVLVNELNTINISDLDNGIYVFKVINNAQTIKTGKLIKQ